ncbi:MAG TPA: sugar-binding protein [Chthoniobacteraceae bacterium]|nr:sugar-binding protein [Chthoniobacteraceae bacterium]
MKTAFLLLAILFTAHALPAAGVTEIPFGKENALVSTEFTGGVTDRRSEAKVWRDATNLYVALWSEHGALVHKADVLTGHDDPVYRDDCVEIFLDAEGRGTSFYQIVANVNGAIFDHFRDDHRRSLLRWDSDATVKGRYGTDFYEIEVAIPLASLNLGNNPSREIGLAVGTHTRYNKDNRSTWGEYHQPQTWKRFTLTGDYPVVLASWSGSEAAGEQQFEFALKNVSERDLSLTGAFNDREITVNLPAGETRELLEETLHTLNEPVEHRLVLRDGTHEVVRFVRKFTPHPLLHAVPASALLFEGDAIRITGRINEDPSAPLEVVLHSGEKTTRKEIPLSGRRFSVAMPQERTDRVECSYKGETLAFELESIASPWSEK